ncbi:hypothetical protein H0X32_04205 [Patescibacteria group bacterium]|nr:hypothetical protein [Patescibacteria group bacterium]
MEHLQSDTFWVTLKILANRGRLSRIVFEEIHTLLVDESYRTSFSHVKKLRAINVPFLLISATVPADIVPIIKDRMGLLMLQTMRYPTPRLEIKYIVKAGTNLMSLMHSFIEANPLRGDERGIVFVLTKDDARRLGDIGYIPYHGDLDESERASAFKRWTSGESKILAATKAFGAGVDYAAVRWTVHLGLPRNIYDFAQESGRAGRDGKSATSLLLCLPDPVQREKMIGSDEVMEFVKTQDCRRSVLSKMFDGFNTNCFALETKSFCDLCQVALSTVKGSSVRSVAETIYTPTFTAEVSAMQGVLRDDRARVAELAECLMLLQEYCALCLLKGREEKHKIIQCRTINCFKCGNVEHRSRQCPNSINLATSDRVHYFCGLPNTELGHILCPAPMGRDCIYAGIGKIVSCQIWENVELRAYRSFIEERYGPFADFNGYKLFLGQFGAMSRIANYMFVTADCVNNRQLIRQ